jgi:hypothetical protein
MALPLERAVSHAHVQVAGVDDVKQPALHMCRSSHEPVPEGMPAPLEQLVDALCSKAQRASALQSPPASAAHAMNTVLARQSVEQLAGSVTPQPTRAMHADEQIASSGSASPVDVPELEPLLGATPLLEPLLDAAPLEPLLDGPLLEPLLDAAPLLLPPASLPPPWPPPLLDPHAANDPPTLASEAITMTRWIVVFIEFPCRARPAFAGRGTLPLGCLPTRKASPSSPPLLGVPGP